MGGRAMTRNAGKGDKSKFAKELESILSTEIKRRDEANDSSRGQGGNVVGSGGEVEARPTEPRTEEIPDNRHTSEPDLLESPCP